MLVILKKFYDFVFNFVCLTIYLLAFNNLISQSIPSDFSEARIISRSINKGENWKKNSTLKPFVYDSLIDKSFLNKDSIYINISYGLSFLNKEVALHGFIRTRYKKYFYSYIFSRFVTNTNTFDSFSGIERDISRFGFNAGETDMSGIGFKNDWFLFEISRGRQVLGAGEGIELVLGETSPSYDNIILGFFVNDFRFKYFHGYLETIFPNINRYIVGKSLEYTNKKNLVFSLSEISIYSGQDRTIDFAYLNPISSHLEIEYNKRANSHSTSSGNAVWQAASDLYLGSSTRLSLNILFDEFIFDQIQRDDGKEDAYAYSFKYNKVIKNENNRLISFYISNILVGTPTFRHISGYNNFVIRDKPLGWLQGSDTWEIKVGADMLINENNIIDLCIGYIEKGEESIISNPYDQYTDHLKGPYPSGYIEIYRFFDLALDLAFSKNFNFKSQVKVLYSNNQKNELELKTGLYFRIPNSSKPQ